MSELIETFYRLVDKQGWLFLFFAGFFEILWAVCLKLSDGWTRMVPTIATIPLGLLSAGCLAMAMRTIPLGISYAVWIGIGAIGAVFIGIQYFHETISPLKLLCVGLIIAGIIGLKILHFTQRTPL